MAGNLPRSRPTSIVNARGVGEDSRGAGKSCWGPGRCPAAEYRRAGLGGRRLSSADSVSVTCARVVTVQPQRPRSPHVYTTEDGQAWVLGRSLLNSSDDHKDKVWGRKQGPCVREGQQGPLWRHLWLEEAQGCLTEVGGGGEARLRRAWGPRNPSAHLGVTRRPLAGTTSRPGSHYLHIGPLSQVSRWVTPPLPVRSGTLSLLGLLWPLEQGVNSLGAAFFCSSTSCHFKTRKLRPERG